MRAPFAAFVILAVAAFGIDIGADAVRQAALAIPKADGERGVAGNDRLHFNRPTDAAVASDGSFYVSDGYENSRVMKFAADGTFVLTWGTKGKGPAQFDLPHGIALDAAGRVFVVDRQNGRV